ncbi:MAG: mechanosensitive ion channel family protein [Firmicutes bacterium]|jgi:small-conductance mechanosensitive channel|nr:mechanosensitive ion channel family protein [Bacillota bacterium]MDD4336454.1 mechanosensitive ion channel family protein [Bacillota bacterium]MDD4791858.1 mechanosensitive ion channel family protein [Bacillota bacterium]
MDMETLSFSSIGDALAEEFPTEGLAGKTMGVVSTLIKIAVIVVIAAIVIRIAFRVIDRLFRSREDEHLALLKDTRRLVTLRSVSKSITRYVVYFIGAIMILSELGVDTASLIAGAGIVGLAVGFGAQNLVKDVITGFFVLFEDQYAVGDYVSVAGVSGVVESIGIRVTRIRDFGGQLHIIPNGSIGMVTNFQGHNMRVVFDVPVPYSVDVEDAVRVLEKAFEDQKESVPGIVEGPDVLGVQDMNERGVFLRVWAMAEPMQQWSVERQLKMIARKSLDEAGVEPPVLHRRIIVDDSVGPSLACAEKGTEDRA